eukprot:6246553-Pyramimonas_sp.AAC.1
MPLPGGHRAAPQRSGQFPSGTPLVPSILAESPQGPKKGPRRQANAKQLLVLSFHPKTMSGCTPTFGLGSQRRT